MPEWLRDETGWLFELGRHYGVWFVLASLLLVIAGLFAISIVLIRIPADFFLESKPRFQRPEGRHPALHLALMVFKNLVGAVLILAGAILSLPGIPGPGILTLLIGFSLTDVPGKRNLERKIIQNRLILNTINGIRARAGRPPLIITEGDRESTKSGR
jgi:hypothetical protein